MRIRGIDPRAVVIGALLSFVLDIVGGLALMAWLAPPALFEGQLDAADFERLLSETLAAPPFLVASLLLGTVSHVAGAFATARLARQAPYTNAMGIALLGLVLGVVLYDTAAPFWSTAIGFLLLVPASWLGAVLAERRGRPSAG